MLRTLRSVFAMMTKKSKWLMMNSFNRFVIESKNKKKKLKKLRKRKKTDLFLKSFIFHLNKNNIL
jgi:hypothetical protein